jgi:hypothetical protein
MRKPKAFINSTGASRAEQHKQLLRAILRGRRDELIDPPQTNPLR